MSVGHRPQTVNHCKELDTKYWYMMKMDLYIKVCFTKIEGSNIKRDCSSDNIVMEWKVRITLMYGFITAFNVPVNTKCYLYYILLLLHYYYIMHLRVYVCAIWFIKKHLFVFLLQHWKTHAFSWWTSRTTSCGCHCLMSRCQTRVDTFASSTQTPRRKPMLTSLC